MSVGRIQFEPLANGRISMSMFVGDQLILKSSSVESIAREAELRKLKGLRLADTFEFRLPADSSTLAEANQAQLEYPLVASKLVAACIWLADIAQLTAPERRALR